MLRLQIESGTDLLFVNEESGTCFAVTFLRTLRVPDDGQAYPLPPGLGPLPVRRVKDYADRVPREWLAAPGVIIPLYNREALWLHFSRRHGHPNAVKIAAGKVNALSGQPFTTRLLPPRRPSRLRRFLGAQEVQDYIVSPPQGFVDGFHTGQGTVRQFVAVPLGQGYTVEGQVTGREVHGGLQVVVYEPKAGRFPQEPARPADQGPDLLPTTVLMDPPTLPPVPAPGVNLFGKYELLTHLATGGMAEVYLARVFGGPKGLLVVKRLLDRLAEDPEFVEMFLDEARISARFAHGNVAQVMEMGQVAGQYFMAMEYVPGLTVAQLGRMTAQRLGQVPQGVACGIIAQACAGLHHAHESKLPDGSMMGIIHRDVSPQNVMLTYEGHVKVVDFGIAKAEGRATQTRAGLVKGKFAYMSPEQCLGEPIDRRTDVFALGIVLFELCTSRRLFKRGSTFDIYDAIVSCDIPPPTSISPAVPRAVEAVILKALAKNKEDRFPTADAMRVALEAAMRVSGIKGWPRDLASFLREHFAAEFAEHEELMRQVQEGAEDVPAQRHQMGELHVDDEAATVVTTLLPPVAGRPPPAPVPGMALEARPTGRIVAPQAAPLSQDKTVMAARPEPRPEVELRDLGLAAGGQIAQKIYPDPHGIDTWDENNFGWAFVHIVTPAVWQKITGEPPPPSPVSARSYSAAGYPWFQVYDADMGDVRPSDILSSIKSLAQLDAERRVVDLDDNDSLQVGVAPITPGRR